MEVKITVPYKTDMSIIENIFQDLYIDFEDEDENESYYFYGKSTESYDDGEEDVYPFDDCVYFCGFCDAIIPMALCMIDGNGGWAQGMIRRKDFSGYMASEEDIAELKRISGIYWDAHANGQVVKLNSNTR